MVVEYANVNNFDDDMVVRIVSVTITFIVSITLLRHNYVYLLLSNIITSKVVVVSNISVFNKHKTKT